MRYMVDEWSIMVKIMVYKSREMRNLREPPNNLMCDCAELVALRGIFWLFSAWRSQLIGLDSKHGQCPLYGCGCYSVHIPID